MYQAIVFLPLLGAIIAGLITVVGARRDHAGGEPSVRLAPQRPRQGTDGEAEQPGQIRGPAS